MTFEWLVALRYLRSPNRPAVLRIVTLLAVIGVAAGVTTLVIALSMNTGFRQAIRDRLLSVTAHINLKPIGPNGIRDYRELMTQLSDTPGVRSIEPAIYSTVLVSAEGRGPGTGTARERSATSHCGRQRRFCAGCGRDSSGAGGTHPGERSGYFGGRLHHTDQPARKLDAFWDAATLAAFPRERNFRFRFLRLRRELGIRDAGVGAVAGGDWGRGQFAGSTGDANGRRAWDRCRIVAARWARIHDVHLDRLQSRFVSRAEFGETGDGAVHR